MGSATSGRFGSTRPVAVSAPAAAIAASVEAVVAGVLVAEVAESEVAESGREVGDDTVGAATGAAASMLAARLVMGRSVSVVLAHWVVRASSVRAALTWKSCFISDMRDKGKEKGKGGSLAYLRKAFCAARLVRATFKKRHSKTTGVQTPRLALSALF